MEMIKKDIRKKEISEVEAGSAKYIKNGTLSFSVPKKINKMKKFNF